MFCASLQRRDPPLKFALPKLSGGESEGLVIQITEALGEQAASLQVSKGLREWGKEPGLGCHGGREVGGRRESAAGNLLFEGGSLWPVLPASSEVGLVRDRKGCKGSASGIIMTESGSFLSKF